VSLPRERYSENVLGTLEDLDTVVFFDVVVFRDNVVFLDIVDELLGDRGCT
jgi:hypothetical protein